MTSPVDTRPRCRSCRTSSELLDRGLCEPCRRYHDEIAVQRCRERWRRLTAANPRAARYSLATFPAADVAGEHALRLGRRWLLTSRGVLVDEHCRPLRCSKETEESWYDAAEELLEEHESADAYTFAGAYIYGPVGSGKTGLAWSLLRTLHDDDRDGVEDLHFANLVTALAQAKRAMNDSTTADPLPELMRADTLVLDDVGAERLTDWTRSVVLELIQYRHDQNRSTIVTSNFDPARLARRLGQDDLLIGKRIVSRLVDGATKIKLDRADLRAKREAA